MLTVADIASMPGLDVAVAGGSEGLGRELRWLHVSELSDPTAWLEGGELLLTTGLGVGDMSSTQRAYVRRLAGHGLAGLGFGLGFGFGEVPPAIVEEANRLGFPVLAIPYDTPFIAITKAAFTHLANEQLEDVTRALEVHERLSQAVLDGRGVQALLAILSERLTASVCLVDERGRVVAERHNGRRLDFEEDTVELPVVAGGETATLKAVREAAPLTEFDRLVLHHGQTALAFELSRRRAVSAAELRLAGDLLEDLEHDRLDEREISRRMAAFGLDPARTYAAVLAVPANGGTAEALRHAVARELDARAATYLSAARRDRASFLVEAKDEQEILTLAGAVAETLEAARVGVGRPGSGSSLGRSLLEARAALDTGVGGVASYRDLGSLELLLGLPDAALEAYVDRVLGPAAHGALLESLTVLLESGCRWSEAADRLGVHRHTLRYRMERLADQTGRHPDRPQDRMELWLAVKAEQALSSRAQVTSS